MGKSCWQDSSEEGNVDTSELKKLKKKKKKKKDKKKKEMKKNKKRKVILVLKVSWLFAILFSLLLSKEFCCAADGGGTWIFYDQKAQTKVQTLIGIK
jgi:hypothetical protein